MKKFYPLVIFFGAIILISMGLYLVMSASSTYSNALFSDQFHLFSSHLVRAGGGVAVLIAFSMIPYRVYKNGSKIILTAVVLVLFITLIVSLEVKGARRWLDIGIATFQPTEFAKLFLFLHIASMLADPEKDIRDFKKGFQQALFWIVVTSGLVIAQPNISNGILLISVSFLILFLAGAKFKHLFLSGAALTSIMVLVMVFFSHSRARLQSYLDAIMNDGVANSQVAQAILGLGSGNWWGVGIGNSSQRNLFLPEAYGDFIFAILGEETGFIGAISLLFIYLVVFIVGLIIAKNAKDSFGVYLSIGIICAFITQAFVNALVAMGAIPTTGLTLPLVSYGGSSLIVFCMSLGILINIGLNNLKETDELEAVQKT